ncbi:acyl-CoA dehydrogenase family protein [Euzebya sp.]|uniref:acyl-CoA dehydrogenase family protein n=1 Tax=Euzebya sp. TaxID=1971409 RepID=UPI003511F454
MTRVDTTDPFGLQADLHVDLGEDVEAFRAELRGWLAGNVPRGPRPTDEAARFEIGRAWQRRMAEAGWAGIAWPTEYGGRGAGALQQFVYYEELARAGAPAPVNQPGIILFGPTLMVYGSEELKRRYLPRMLTAEDVWCQGFSEPEAGSDLAGLRTTARRDGDGYVVHGQKIWTSWAAYADRCALLCRTDPDEPRHRGLSMVILDLHQPGVEVRPIVQITGERDEFGELFLDGATVAGDHLVGEEGQGWAAAMRMLEFERSDLGLHDHARLQVRLNTIGAFLADAISDRRLTGLDAVDLRRRFADAWVRCGLLRQFNLGVASELAAGRRPGAMSSVLRLYWSDLAQVVESLGLDVVGPDSPLAVDDVRTYLHSRHTTIASGTSEVQRGIVAEHVLGLPRDRRGG